MADIIPFPGDEAAAAEADEDVARDRFLIDEGLDLLAAFRAIEDPAVRASIMSFVKAMAKASGRAVVQG